MNIAAFCDALGRHEGIQITYSSLRRILKGAEVRAENQRKARKRHRDAAGELLHLGVGILDWLGEGTPCALHLILDDATDRVLGMHLCRRECLMGYVMVLRQALADYGIPDGIHLGRPRLLRPADGKGQGGGAVQLGSILCELVGDDVNDDDHAFHAQRHIDRLMRRVERLLPNWLKRRKAASMEEANAMLCRHITIFNGKNAAEPRSEDAVFSPFADKGEIDRLVAVRHDVLTGGDGSFSFDDFIFCITSTAFRVTRKVSFCFGPHTGFVVKHENKWYDVSVLRHRESDTIADTAETLDLLVRKYYFAALDE